MTKHRIKKRTLIAIVIFLFLVAIVFAAVIVYWNKLDLIQYEEKTVVTGEETTTAYTLDESDYDEPSESNDTDSEEPTTKKVSQLISTDTVEKLSNNDQKVVEPTEEPLKTDIVMNVLLIATDESTETFTNNANSDCMIILSINKQKNTVKLVSLERGTGVPISIGQYKGEYEWLNHMIRIGGPGYLQSTVEEVFRVDLMGYIRINPQMFVKIVDACGGVDIVLTSSEATYINKSMKSEVVSEGSNHLDGKMAELYARCRSIDDDWSRIERQRKVIQSAITQADGMSLAEINSLIDQILPLIQTNLTKQQITDLVLQIPNVAGKTAAQMSLPSAGTYGIMQNTYGKNMFSVDFDKNSQILEEFLYS